MVKASIPSTSKVGSSTTSFTSPTSTRGKKKQLQERGLVLVTDQKDQLLDIFSIRNTINQRFMSKLRRPPPPVYSHRAADDLYHNLSTAITLQTTSTICLQSSRCRRPLPQPPPLPLLLPLQHTTQHRTIGVLQMRR